VSAALTQKESRALKRKARTATLDALEALGGEARRRAIHDWTLAHNYFTARELAAPQPPAATKYLNLVDHQLSWTLTNLKRDGLVENPQPSIWRLTSTALSPSTTTAKQQVHPERLAELREMPYSQYLRTPEWRQTRAEALLRAGSACSLDATHTKRLEVHHRTYKRLGAELVYDLTVLCHACHQLYHTEYGRPRRERPQSPSVAMATEHPQQRHDERPKRGIPSLLRRLLAG